MASTHILNIIIQVTDRATAPLKGVESNLNRLEKSFGGMNKRMLGLGLGMTFFMWGVQMQLQRVLRSMFNTFTLAEGETGALNQQFNIVRANLAAISIAFFDAFAQSGLFEFVIDVVSRIADWYLDLTDKQKQWVTEGVIGTYAVMKAISFLGQLLLAVYVAVQLGAAVWLPYALLAVGAIFLVWKTYKAFKSAFVDMNKGLEENTKLIWSNWAAKVLDWVLVVVRALASLPRKIQNMFFGGIVDTSIVESGLEKAQSALRGKFATPASTIGVVGSYKEMSPKAIASGYYGSSITSKQNVQ